MSNTLQDIANYIDFLRSFGFSISVCCFNSLLDKHLPVLLNYEAHLPAVCSYLKSMPDTRNKCIKNKQRLNHRAPRSLYYSCCWAGVEEYVIPIVYHDILVCCINLSGYRGFLDKSKVLSDKLTASLNAEFCTKYFQLSTAIPNIKTVNAITMPLQYMFYVLCEESIEAYDKNNAPSAVYANTLKYINEHYMEDLSIDSIALAMNYSPSYLRYIFKQNGKTIMNYVKTIRLTQAANLLKFTNNSITDIAYSCGFIDSNYFSAAFKKHFKTTPTKYRKESSVKKF